MLPILAPDQSAAWDQHASHHGVALATLMESAGRASAALVAARFPEATRGGVLVAAGPGHNGGDGWVIARALHRVGAPVWLASAPGEPAELTRHMATLARGDGVREVAPDGPWPRLGLVVDALLGTGASGAPRAPIAALLERALDLELPVVAVDGPTGLDLLTGVGHGAPRADLTITFGALRRGHLLARDEVGDVIVVDIGHLALDQPAPLLVEDADAAAWLAPFSASAHKGTRGRVVIVGGAAGMAGAVRMAARAAFAGGAGLVHAVAPADTIAVLVAGEPDVQTLAHSFDDPPGDALLDLVHRADALVIGPGLGRAPNRRGLVRTLVEAAPRALLDADALIAFADSPDLVGALTATRPVVLTPHRGEFRALFPDLAGTAELDPWSAAEAAAERTGATVLLKGVPTVVARAGRPTLTIAAGNPGLATGGSGDVLAGLVGTALAQAHEPEIAAALGAQALGRAADLGARRVTARALRPADVVHALPDLWREWDTLRLVPPAPRPPVLLELGRPRAS